MSVFNMPCPTSMTEPCVNARPTKLIGGARGPRRRLTHGSHVAGAAEQPRDAREGAPVDGPQCQPHPDRRREARLVEERIVHRGATRGHHRSGVTRAADRASDNERDRGRPRDEFSGRREGQVEGSVFVDLGPLAQVAAAYPRSVVARGPAMANQHDLEHRGGQVQLTVAQASRVRARRGALSRRDC